MCGRLQLTIDGRGQTGRWILKNVETGKQFDPTIKFPPQDFPWEQAEIKPTQKIPIFG